MAWNSQTARSGFCSSRRSMGLWARTTARKWLFCNHVMGIGEVEDIKRNTRCPSSSTSKINNHHSTIINQNQLLLAFLLSTLSHLLSGGGAKRILAIANSPGSKPEVGGVPQSGGLRTPAEMCRPPG